MNVKRAVEFLAIQADSLWACRFGMSAGRRPEALSAVSLSVFNYLSLFRFESLKYLHEVHPDFAALLPQPTTDELERSRNTIKFFDVHEHVDGVIDYFTNDIRAVHERHFLNAADSPLAQAVRTDLGLTYYGNRIIYTTHGTAFTSGISSSTLLGSDEHYVKDTAERYGQHFGAFYYDRTQELGPSFTDKLNVNLISSEDIRAERYYERHFNGSATPGINALLCVFLASLNFLDSMVRLDDLPESRQTILKMQYITLYHVTSSLKKLRSSHAPDLSQRSLDYIDQIVSDSTLGTITGGSSRILRNTFIHYGLHPEVQDGELNPCIVGYGLIEKYLPGHDYASLSEAVTGQIERIAEVFNEWA